MKKISAYYNHFYRYEGELDMVFLNRYDSIVLEGINEYSVEIYKKVLPHWKGHEVVLVSSEWNDYLELFPKLSGISVTVFEHCEQVAEIDSGISRKRLYIKEGVPCNEGPERYKQGVMYYDEIMILTFLFSCSFIPKYRRKTMYGAIKTESWRL